MEEKVRLIIFKIFFKRESVVAKYSVDLLGIGYFTNCPGYGCNCIQLWESYSSCEIKPRSNNSFFSFSSLIASSFVILLFTLIYIVISFIVGYYVIELFKKLGANHLSIKDIAGTYLSTGITTCSR